MLKESQDKGLVAAERYYQDYGVRARELREEGKKIIGYLCAYVPLEMIAAAGFMPLRIKGNVNEPVTKADSQMETIICPFVRSCFDLALKGRYQFLDGLVIPHSCDSVTRTYDIWKYSLELPYCHLINLPHTTSGPSMEFLKEILVTFRKSLGRFAGKDISDDKIEEAIHIYNNNRALMRELYQLRNPEPPLISGVEITKVLVAAMGIPVEESNRLIGSVIDEAKQREVVATEKLPRIMVIGAQIDDVVLIKLIEDSGAYVVADDLCVGSKVYRRDVDTGEDPIGALAERYLVQVMCPRTYREKTGTYEEYLEQRFGHIRDYVEDARVDGVILFVYKYCDPYGFEVPATKDYIESLGVPVLYLEDEYSMASIGRLRTRIQAFLELIGSK